MRFPVWATGPSPRAARPNKGTIHAGIIETEACWISDNDWIAGDEDGVVVVIKAAMERKHPGYTLAGADKAAALGDADT
jgi:regulator of RNase E activity RraA